MLQVVNGKEIQIQLTGFMEKNTGKFMKELWTLLLSAEKNASGVPQQFLDEKEEEVKKKKVPLFFVSYLIGHICNCLPADPWYHICNLCRRSQTGKHMKFRKGKRRRLENVSKRKWIRW